MTHWIQQLLWHSFAISVVTLVYYAATVGLRKRYASKWFYLAGVILLVGSLIPVRPVVTVKMQKIPEFLQGIAMSEGFGQPSASGISSVLPEAALDSAQGIPWGLVIALWAVGALTTILYHSVKHARFVSAVKRWRVDVKDAQSLSQLEEIKKQLAIEGHDIGFALCECVRSPLLLWIKKPTVVLPAGGQSSDDMRFILSHELTHYKRKDLLCRFIMLLSTAIHWFNPAIYFLVKLVTIQCEISCDEKVVENQDIEIRHQYAMSIISVARCHSKGYTLLTTYYNGGKDTMKKRINSVYEPTKKRIGILLLACTLCMTLLAGISIAADTDEFKYTLPENSVKLDEALDSYIVSWEPMDGIKEYSIGVYYNIQFEETTFKYPPIFDADGNVIVEAYESEPTKGFWKVAVGWIGDGIVTDGAGNEYEVQGCWEAAKLPGDATELDISEMINSQIEPIGIDYDPDTYEWNQFAKKEALLGCTMKVVAIREEGAPLVVDIEIPVE